LRGALSSDDAEYLHQARVALRRLRVLLRMAEKLCANEQLSCLIKDIAVLCVELGRIREWDVFIDQTLRPVCTRMAGHAGLQVVLEASERQRDACYAELRGEAQARELQRLILRFAIWMNGSYWQRQDRVAPSARDFAARHLRKLAKRFKRSAQHFDAADAVQLHALRIVVKRLKYSAEFFAMLYGKHKAQSYLAGLSEVQEVLGQINDVAVAHRMLEELAALPELSAQQEAIALAKGWIAHDLSRLFTVLRNAVRYFYKQPAFWEW
jgi:CHAD domain-containing protein